MIKKVNDGFYYFLDEVITTKILFLGNSVFTYGGPAIRQHFTVKTEPTFRSLPSLFGSYDEILKRASLYQEGHTNKEKFKKELNRLLGLGSITRDDVKKLTAFINSSNFFAQTVVNQLKILGYGDLGEHMDFSEPRTELVDSCRHFEKFIKEIPQHLDKNGCFMGEELRED